MMISYLFIFRCDQTKPDQITRHSKKRVKYDSTSVLDQSAQYPVVPLNLPSRAYTKTLTFRPYNNYNAPTFTPYTSQTHNFTHPDSYNPYMTPPQTPPTSHNYNITHSYQYNITSPDHNYNPYITPPPPQTPPTPSYYYSIPSPQNSYNPYTPETPITHQTSHNYNITPFYYNIPKPDNHLTILHTHNMTPTPSYHTFSPPSSPYIWDANNTNKYFMNY